MALVGRESVAAATLNRIVILALTRGRPLGKRSVKPFISKMDKQLEAWRRESMFKVGFRYLVPELALESVIPVPLEASVNICSKIVLFFL